MKRLSSERISERGNEGKSYDETKVSAQTKKKKVVKTHLNNDAEQQ
jgi:hypothetical protein